MAKEICAKIVSAKRCENDAIEGGRLCMFHDPKEWRRTPKSLLEGIIEQIRCDKFNFEAYSFPSIDFSKAIEGKEFKKPVVFKDANFHGPASFRKIKFRKVVFQGAIFSANAKFDYTTFLGDANFAASTFIKVADFESARFSAKALFNDVAFSEKAIFRNTLFHGRAQFNKAAFLENADFSAAKFSDVAVFRNAKFSNVADFVDSRFSSFADFSGASFSGQADFDSARFFGKTALNNIEFSREAILRNATFSESVSFEDSEFLDDTFYSDAVFSKKATFNRAKFSGKAWFSGAEFGERAKFDGAMFYGDADFDARFRKGTNFTFAKFSSEARTHYRMIFERESFDKANLDKIIEYLRSLSEEQLRKILRSFFAREISRGNVQLYHGFGEHGVDIQAVIDREKDALAEDQVIYAQVKKGDLKLDDWMNRVAGQLGEALRSTTFPRGTGRDNPRRLLLVLNGEMTPEVHEAIRSWNQTQPLPVQILDIHKLADLFCSKYKLKISDLKKLAEF